MAGALQRPWCERWYGLGAGTEANLVCHEEPRERWHQIGAREHGSQDREKRGWCLLEP